MGVAKGLQFGTSGTTAKANANKKKTRKPNGTRCDGGTHLTCNALLATCQTAVLGGDQMF
jgi:hypothetical protein